MTPEIIRIQFDIPADEYKRDYAYYIPNDKYRHKAFKDAGLEYCNRKKGRDKKARMEQLESDIVLLTPIIEEMKDRGII